MQANGRIDVQMSGLASSRRSQDPRCHPTDVCVMGLTILVVPYWGPCYKGILLFWDLYWGVPDISSTPPKIGMFLSNALLCPESPARSCERFGPSFAFSSMVLVSPIEQAPLCHILAALFAL